MLKIINKTLLVSLCALSLTACNGFFEKDNTPTPHPLVSFASEVSPTQIWSTSAGSGNHDDYLKLNPGISCNAIYTASSNGTVTSVNKMSGRINWQVNTKQPLMTGPGAGDGIVVVGSREGRVIALQEANGAVLWQRNVPGELLANPTVANGRVIVKAVDGFIGAFAVNDGHEFWSFQETEPSLVLRGSSSPVVKDNHIYAGFANGNLAKFSFQDGHIVWMKPMATPTGAFAIQRMTDIDADPLFYSHHLYAATYQGQISSVEWDSGQAYWSHDISSYTGMAADDGAVYITDATGHVWAFTANSGLVEWRQTQLEARILSGPASMGNYVVVGDAQGYLHWLNKRDGHFGARVFVGSPIYAAPIVENNVLYALANNGKLVAYRL